MFFLKIEKNIILDCFSHSRQKAEGYYQSSGLDLYCYVLILNVIQYTSTNLIVIITIPYISESLVLMMKVRKRVNTDCIVLIEIK